MISTAVVILCIVVLLALLSSSKPKHEKFSGASNKNGHAGNWRSERTKHANRRIDHD